MPFRGVLRFYDHGLESSSHHILLRKFEQRFVVINRLSPDLNKLPAPFRSSLRYDWKETAVHIYPSCLCNSDGVVCSSSEYDKLHYCASSLWAGSRWYDITRI